MAFFYTSNSWVPLIQMCALGIFVESAMVKEVPGQSGENCDPMITSSAEYPL